jgi:hypothetical protein
MKLLSTSILVACALFLNAQIENGCISLDFESFPDETPVSGLVLSDQYKDAFGLSFRLEGGGFPVLAQVGGNVAEAFGSAWGNDTPAPGVDIGQFFLTDDGQLSGLTSPPIILDFEIPIDSFAGCILDMDFQEFFIIQALDEFGQVILEERFDAGDPNTGDGELTCWGFNLPGCEGSIYSIRYAGFRPESSQGAFGLGMDFFSFCYSGLQIDTDIIPATCNEPGAVNIFSTTDEVYEYSLDGINYSLNGFFDQLDEGIQQIFVRDADNCTTSVEVMVELDSSELPDPIFVDEEICSGDTFSFNGEEYTDAGMYQQTLSAANGCDTLWNLTLSVLPNLTEEIVEEICEGDIIDINGIPYSMSGQFEQELMTAGGCDSIILIDLTVNPVTAESIETSICEGESLTLNGETYVSAGNYIQMTTNSLGCDSILNLNLVVLSPTSENLSAEICEGESFQLNGESYTAAGAYTQVLTNSESCDSVLTLQLDVLQSSTETISAQTCEGDTYLLNGQSYTTAGTFTQNLTNVAGCDSLLILELELTSVSTGVINEEICEGSDIIINGISYATAGSFSQNLINEENCDSLLTININFLPATETCESVTIFDGEVFTSNGESFTVEGTYEQLLQSSEGCDSLIIIKLSVLPMPLALVHYDLDNCAAGGTSYDELSPRYDAVPDCAEINASILSRPSGLPHSCTPGEMGSGMCVSADPACVYQDNSEHRLIFDVFVDPMSGPVVISGMRFFEKAPINYEFNAGGTGQNNYPTLYSVRIMKDAAVIYSDQSVTTNRDWTLQSYDFVGLDDFVFDQAGMMTVEFLAYCPIGITSNVSAWDIDELSLFGFCEPDNNRVIGNVQTNKLEPLSNVKITVSDGDDIESYLSGRDGQFAFETAYNSSAVDVELYKNDDPLNGVSTLDLIYIQRHILGIDGFDEFSDFIAADINKDNVITAIDLLELRKMILGFYDDFPQNTSWRFLDTSTDYDVLSDLDDKVVVTNFDDALNMEGVKVGDVNQSHVLNADDTYLDSRSKSEYNLTVRERRESSGELVYGFYASEDFMLSGIQATFDVGHIEKLNLIPHRLNIGEQNFHLNNGRLKISWSDHDQNFEKGDLLFEFVSKGDFDDSRIQLDSNSQNEIYQASDLTPHSLNLEFEKGESYQNSDTAIQLNVHPNPFNTETIVQIRSQKNILTKYNLIDVNGRLIVSNPIQLEAGINNIKINRSELPGGGMYFIVLAQEDDMYVQKIVMY